MDPADYSKKFITLIARERNAEIDFHTKEIKTLSGAKREKKGRTILSLKRQESKTENESIFRFVRNTGSKLPHNEFSIGSNVLVSKNDPLDGLKGVVMFKSQYAIDVYIATQSRMLYQDNLRLDLFVNDTTYNAQKTILKDIMKWSFNSSRDIILHNERPKIGPIVEVDFYDKTLNESQKLAVKYSVREKEFYLIQGPPGTGKTKTSVEIVRQHLHENKTVLVTADSNVAVDNIMMGLLKHIDVIRIGESPKIMPEIQEHTISRIIQNNFQYKILIKGNEKIVNLRKIQRNELIPNRKNSKGISYFQLCKLAERGQSDFGISLENLESMARWINAQQEIKNIQSNIEKVKKKIIEDSIGNAKVICTTNTNANSPYLENVVFDMLLIDEAGQSTEPSCLIPISKSKKIILVGDHKQLPPTILSSDAQELSISLFERMMTNSRYTLLDTQYRMHPLINSFPSKEFYNSDLKSAENIGKEWKSLFEKNVVFIECKGVEKKHKGATSFFNLEEVEAVMNLIPDFQKKGIVGEDIGIISPYLEQVKTIRERMPTIEVNSIDGFQGREKKIIVISLVRSNNRGEIGFLKDLRRLNVALTRAKFQLIVIGNPDTISVEPTYKRFLKFVKEQGTYIKNC